MKRLNVRARHGVVPLVVTIFPWRLRAPRGEHVKEGPGHDDVIVDAAQEGDDQHGHADT